MTRLPYSTGLSVPRAFKASLIKMRLGIWNEMVAFAGKNCRRQKFCTLRVLSFAVIGICAGATIAKAAARVRAENDFVGWMDRRLIVAVEGEPITVPDEVGKALIEPLRQIHGISDKILN